MNSKHPGELQLLTSYVMALVTLMVLDWYISDAWYAVLFAATVCWFRRCNPFE